MYKRQEHIKEAGIAAIQNNQTRYTPSAGILPLREAICDRILQDTGVHYAPSQICVTSGAKHNVYIALQAIINAGEEVILPAPYWVTYAEAIRMAGGVPIIVETTEETGFKLTPEMLSNAITPRSKAVMLTNPSNPTGMVSVSYTHLDVYKRQGFFWRSSCWTAPASPPPAVWNCGALC